MHIGHSNSIITERVVLQGHDMVWLLMSDSNIIKANTHWHYSPFDALDFLFSFRLTFCLSIRIPVIANIKKSVQLMTIKLCSGFKFIFEVSLCSLLQFTISNTQPRLLLFDLIDHAPHFGPLFVLSVMRDQSLCGVI